MAYYLRAFCTTGVPPILGDVLEFASSRGSNMQIDPKGPPAAVTDGLSAVALRYKVGRAPIVVELNLDDGPGGLVREEVAEFLEAIEGADDEGRRTQVERHLRATTFIVAEQLFTGDIDDDGYNAAGNVLTYFLERHGAMIQADGEGFYEGRDLILELA